ncbi:MAG: hypothetical protein A2X11_14040 [Bacteroidetes bacterium GWE2_42_24]|nr:MAG: hypothetical protein A2X11_14040 [Bacteroidetes bacterium GWE2_42_24]OFY27249.1 MAG: hypothetical protein A2X09_13165 [Bacteroidetes bacterium GWF2_43_11]
MVVLCLVVLIISRCEAQPTKFVAEGFVELFNGALADMRKQDLYAAEEKLRGALALDSTFREVWLALNEILYHTKQKNKQKEYLKLAISRFPEDGDFQYYYGMLLQRDELFDQAIRRYSDAILLNKATDEKSAIGYAYYFNRGVCYYRTGKWKNSLNDFEVAVKLNDTLSYIHVNHGLALQKMGEMIIACKCWRKARSLGDAEAVRLLGKYCKPD